LWSSQLAAAADARQSACPMTGGKAIIDPEALFFIVINNGRGLGMSRMPGTWARAIFNIGGRTKLEIRAAP